jgi:hypothetical protein
MNTLINLAIKQKARDFLSNLDTNFFKQNKNLFSIKKIILPPRYYNSVSSFGNIIVTDIHQATFYFNVLLVFCVY